MGFGSNALTGGDGSDSERLRNGDRGQVVVGDSGGDPCWCGGVHQDQRVYIAKGATAVDPAALSALVANVFKFTPKNVIATARTPNGQIVFPETGNAKAGLQHIVREHASDFAKKSASRKLRHRA